MKIHTILACDNKWGIARDKRMPWKLQREYNYFKQFTSSETTRLPPGRKHALLMGRKTWEGVGDEGPMHPLPNRYNFVLSKSLKNVPEGADGLVASIEEFVHLMTSDEWKSKIGLVFNCGGGEVTKCIQDTKYCGRIYLTRIHKDFDCDTFFPRVDKDERFRLVEKSEPHEDVIPDGIQNENQIIWEVTIYEKIDPDE